MKVKAYAKVNLMLDILKKLDNGYHSLFMLMQSVDLYDIVSVEKNNKNKIYVKSNKDIVSDQKENIAYKSAEAFFEYTDIKDKGIDIYIEKNIPMAAGLAGGSADGAAVIYILNKIFNVNLSLKEMQSISNKVGADIPFSLQGGTAIALNTGDILADVNALPKSYFVLVKPDMDISTPEAYAMMDNLDRIRHLNRIEILSALSDCDYSKIVSLCANVFEQGVEVPERPYIKSIMRKSKADACLMTGSGPTVFGIFSDLSKAEICYEKLKGKYINTFLCKSTDKGIEEI